MIRLFNQLRHYFFQYKHCLIGLCLIFASGLLFLVGHTYKEHELELLNGEVANAHKYKVTTKSQMIFVDDTFDFPNQADFPDILEFIYSEAKINHIDYGSVSYQYLELKPIKAIGYELVMPIFGKYLDVRTFLNKITQNRDEILLSGVELNRADDQSNDIDGSLHITIYLKE